ncbi:MAG: cysteine-rich CWC family protein [Gammaproteobacteria bacterium]|nr:cysteine-rich CWC family protein [Gammaproteobacteria bacterium]MCF6259563.1 cysteine-rich CWC family protein [Gammaproteobacteria bacterium]
MPTTHKHETRHCPRCNTEFECKAGSILLCQCQTVYLSPEQTEYVSTQFDGCLCVTCLQALRSEYNCRQHQWQIYRLRH